MTISKFDLISLVVLVIFAWRGYKKGGMNTLVSLAGLIASFLVPWLIAPWLTEQLMKITPIQTAMLSWIGNTGANQAEMLANASKVLEIASFLLLVILMLVIVGQIKKWLLGTNKLPVIGILNRLAGAVIGITAAVIIMAAIAGGLYYFAQYTGNVNLQEGMLDSSFLTVFLHVMN